PISFEHFNIIRSQKAPQPVASSSGDIEELDQVISDHIRRVLAKVDGKIHGPGGAAELLGINASTLRNRMTKLGISYRRRSKHEK
ncbi:hypothetical protein KAU11_07540, partial [Candidatus Babeliales bacterium]|nr:hypothetical protein [Candidatus Babeliales bacterium]